MSNITEEQKAEFLKYYPDHEDKLEELSNTIVYLPAKMIVYFVFMMLNLIRISQH